MADQVEFFGIRHHSPAGARLVAERIHAGDVAAVLVEGPSEYNSYLEELALPHELPVMIYTWAPMHADAEPGSEQWSDRRGAFYPFSAYAPEWAAVRAAQERGIALEFIDLPWGARAEHANAANLLAEPAELQESALEPLLREVGVDDVDALIDELLELDPELGMDDYRARIERLGEILRNASDETLRRERYMASRIREAEEHASGTVLVVCGAAHISGLRQCLTAGFEPVARWESPDDERYGVALTPTSYAALDALTGYDAGQRNPGFYEALYADRCAGRTGTAQRLLKGIAEGLRDSKQRISVADLIAVSTTARALAALRGHGEVWRTDLVDGVISALVKDDDGAAHPLVARVHEILRGTRVGQLAPGTRRPPLVVELVADLEALGLTPHPKERIAKVDLTSDDGLRGSRLLHSLVALDVRVGALVRSADADGVEHWRLWWTPEYESSLVEASRFGGTRDEAVTTRLLADAVDIVDDPRAAAELMLRAALCGVDDLGSALQARTETLFATTGNIGGLGDALHSLLRLYRYDALWQTTGRADLGALITVAFERLAMLVERVGPLPDAPSTDPVVAAIRSGVDVIERCQDLPLARAAWRRALHHLSDSPDQAAALRGAGTGAQWLLDGEDDEALATSITLLANPAELGDFVFGLLTVAREAATRRSEFVGALDTAVTSFDDDDFLAALPGLRRAFSAYPPRERAQIASQLLGEQSHDVLRRFEGSADDVMAVASFEQALLGHVRGFLGEEVW